MSYKGKLLVFIIIIVISVSFNFALFAQDSSGDDKINDMIEDIKRKEEERKKEEKEKEEKERKEKEKEEYGDSDGGCAGAVLGGCMQGMFEGCAEYIFPLLFIYAASIEYAEYPYAESGGFEFSRMKDKPEDKGKLAYLKLLCEPAYLWDDVWGVSGRIDGVLSLLYVSFLYQYNFSMPGSSNFSVLSINGGLQFPIMNVSISLFGGGFRMFLPASGVLDYIIPSFGGCLQIFFPYNIAFEAFSLNAISDYHWFNVFTASLGLSFWRFSSGAGFSYYNYDGTTYAGPSLRLTIWI